MVDLSGYYVKTSWRKASLEHIYFHLMEKERVCAVTKLLRKILYTTDIMNEKGRRSGWKERENIDIYKLRPYLALNK